MKRIISFIACISLLQQIYAQQNEYIVTWSNDTIYCNIVNSPKEVGLRFIKKQVYTYDYIIANFGNDSVRIYPPGKIKAYTKLFEPRRENPFLLYMHSDSVSIQTNQLFKVEKNEHKLHKFIRLLIKGGYYNLYFFEDYVHDGNDRYFVLENNVTKEQKTIFTTKQLRKLLQDWPEANAKDKRYRNWFKGKQYLVIDYNNYKARTL